MPITIWFWTSNTLVEGGGLTRSMSEIYRGGGCGEGQYLIRWVGGGGGVGLRRSVSALSRWGFGVPHWGFEKVSVRTTGGSGEGDGAAPLHH